MRRILDWTVVWDFGGSREVELLVGTRPSELHVELVPDHEACDYALALAFERQGSALVALGGVHCDVERALNHGNLFSVAVRSHYRAKLPRLSLSVLAGR